MTALRQERPQATSAWRKSLEGQAASPIVSHLDTRIKSSEVQDRPVERRSLGGVDSKDSLLGANQIQGCFWGGSLGCEEPSGFERCGVGADGAADYRSTRPERLHRGRQPYVRGRRAADCAYELSLA